MSSGGWVKLWRKSLDSGLLQNHQLWAFWCWCLMKASHKPTKQMVGWQMVELEPGQFVFGRKAAAKEVGISEQTIKTCLKHLKNMKNITIKSTNKFSVITIVNWDSYQGLDQESNQQSNQPSNQQLTSSQPAANQQLTSSQPAANHKQECKKGEKGENVKKGKKEEKSVSQKDTHTGDSWKKEEELPKNLIEMSRGFLQYQQERLGEKCVEVSDKKIKDGARTLNRLIRLDGYNLERDIRPALHWAVEHEIWGPNLRSLSPLRNRGRNGDKKFVTIYNQWLADKRRREQERKRKQEEGVVI